MVLFVYKFKKIIIKYSSICILQYKTEKKFKYHKYQSVWYFYKSTNTFNNILIETTTSKITKILNFFK